MTTRSVRQGSVPFRDRSTAYRIVGDPSVGTPLVVLHGGPGVPHDYLRPLEALATDDRAVVFYDQLGAGRSRAPRDPALWTVEAFREELADLRRALGLGRVHLLGHSWGGMLALEHALAAPDGVASLVLTDTTASMPLHAREVARLRAELPEKVQEVLALHEAAGTTADPAYEEASMTFLARHVCRLDPWPDALLHAFAALEPEIYGAMWGSELLPSGTLRDWDVRARLGEIAAPTLVAGGRHDEMTPAEQQVLHEGIRGSERVVLESSSHLPFLEEPEAWVGAVADFLRRVEARERA